MLQCNISKNTNDKTMTLSSMINSILNRFTKMFSENYQTNLELYLAGKSITDTAMLEYYLKQFHYAKQD